MVFMTILLSIVTVVAVGMHLYQLITVVGHYLKNKNNYPLERLEQTVSQILAFAYAHHMHSAQANMMVKASKDPFLKAVFSSLLDGKLTEPENYETLKVKADKMVETHREEGLRVRTLGRFLPLAAWSVGFVAMFWLYSHVGQEDFIRILRTSLGISMVAVIYSVFLSYLFVAPATWKYISLAKWHQRRCAFILKGAEAIAQGMHPPAVYDRLRSLAEGDESVNWDNVAHQVVRKVA